ncbi:NADP-dependent oxidoreductase [Herbidospora cretacea]|uniref:NADP-dependent oxidoreductase n=1 Tax=Herbidospora cretacea TaxID=28444 RepID=UPI00068D7E29|nr:NADP-dependent oxidoreductase [Herbidospora cretacea]
MRAIGIEHFGETPALKEVPVPEPDSGEVQVAIDAASTNPLDLAIATGALAAVGEYRFPLTLGMDGAGTVTAIGDGVTEFRVGDRVFGQFWSRPLRFGSFAEVAVMQAVPAFGALARIPDELPSDVAAALPTAGTTALGAIDVMRVPEGGTLVILGATGGVGTFAVQAAAARGIRVIATASAQAAEEVRKLGPPRSSYAARSPSTRHCGGSRRRRRHPRACAARLSSGCADLRTMPVTEESAHQRPGALQHPTDPTPPTSPLPVDRLTQALSGNSRPDMTTAPLGTHVGRSSGFRRLAVASK